MAQKFLDNLHICATRCEQRSVRPAKGMPADFLVDPNFSASGWRCLFLSMSGQYGLRPFLRWEANIQSPSPV